MFLFMKEIKFNEAAAITSPNPLVLVCTEKENGCLNIAPVSFFMYTSVNPPMLAFAMAKASNSGENIRRTGKAIISTAGDSLKEAVMTYGSASGRKIDKMTHTPIVLQSVEGSDIQFPEDTKLAFVVSLIKTIEAGDHYLYLCDIDKIVADETKEVLFAWNGYSKVCQAK